MSNCNQSDGAIDLTVTPQGNNYTFAWSNGAQTQNISGIPAGTYSVVVTDVSTNCHKDTTFFVEENNSYTRQTGVTTAHCGQSDGSASVYCTGGTGTFYYIWNTTPQITTSSITNVPAGNYEVTISDGVCTYTLTVTVPDDPGPTAAFSAQPSVMDDLDPVCLFTDLSTGGPNLWNWNFGDGSTSDQTSPLHVFEGIGSYTVMLIVTDTNGCRDTATHQVRVGNTVNFYIPNTFTPNADDINDTFGPSIPFDDLMSYEFRIFSKWGEQIFYTTDIYKRWNGYKNGKICPEDVYVYRIYARDSIGKEHKLTGWVALIK